VNARQQHFAEVYLICRNAARAYEIAYGRTGRTAEVNGSKLLRHTEVAAFLAEKRAKVEKKLEETHEITQAWILGKLRENALRAMQIEPVTLPDGTLTGKYKYAGAVANRALELMAKHKGMFPRPPEVPPPDVPEDETKRLEVVFEDEAPHRTAG